MPLLAQLVIFEHLQAGVLFRLTQLLGAILLADAVCNASCAAQSLCASAVGLLPRLAELVLNFAQTPMAETASCAFAFLGAHDERQSAALVDARRIEYYVFQFEHPPSLSDYEQFEMHRLNRALREKKARQEQQTGQATDRLSASTRRNRRRRRQEKMRAKGGASGTAN